MRARPYPTVGFEPYCSTRAHDSPAVSVDARHGYSLCSHRGEFEPRCGKATAALGSAELVSHGALTPMIVSILRESMARVAAARVAGAAAGAQTLILDLIML